MKFFFSPLAYTYSNKFLIIEIIDFKSDSNFIFIVHVPQPYPVQVAGIKI